MGKHHPSHSREKMRRSKKVFENHIPFTVDRLEIQTFKESPPKQHPLYGRLTRRSNVRRKSKKTPYPPRLTHEEIEHSENVKENIIPSTTNSRGDRTFEESSRSTMPSTADLLEDRTFEQSLRNTMPSTATAQEDRMFEQCLRKHHTHHSQKYRFEKKILENHIPSATNRDKKGINNYFTN